eukprot:gene8907-biopygen10485
MKRGKVVKQNGIALPNGQMMKEIDDSGYKYLAIVEMDKIKETDMKDKFASTNTREGVARPAAGIRSSSCYYWDKN